MTLRSQNGWVAFDTSVISAYTVPNTNVVFHLRDGSAAVVLLWVAEYFNKYIEPISTRKGVKGYSVPDDWGYAARDVRGSTSVISNHGSGTAIDCNATRHPRGVSISHTFSRTQIGHCRDIVSLSGGVIRWGGDYVSAPPDGMHFEINKLPASVQILAAKIQAGKLPGSWKNFPHAAPVPVKPPSEDDVALLICETGQAAVFESNDIICRWVFNPDDLVRAKGFNTSAGGANPTHVYEVAAGSVKAGKYGVLVGPVPPGYEGMPRIETLNAVGSAAPVAADAA